MTDRERGAAAHVCPNCGNELEAVALPDGGVTVEACSSCYPTEDAQAPAKEEPRKRKAPEQAQAQQPIIQRETGTDIGEGVNQ